MIETDGAGGLVDPGAGDGVGDDLGGGLVVVEDDEGLIGDAASRQWDVETARVGGAVEVQEGAVDGTALGGVAGLGVGILGIVYIPLDGGGAWKTLLARELRAAGYDLDVTKLLGNSAGT